jgi:hypothetical protein
MRQFKFVNKESLQTRLLRLILDRVVQYFVKTCDLRINHKDFRINHKNLRICNLQTGTPKEFADL